MRILTSQPRLLTTNYLVQNNIYMNNFNNIDNFNNITNINIKPFDIIPGFGLGIPLNILQLFYTYQHYHINIVTVDMVIFQFMAGIFTYGLDRYIDSSIINTSTDLSNYDSYKINYFNYLQDNKNQISIIIVLSYFYLSYFLIEYKIFIPILTSTVYYRDFKTNFGLFKSTYIACLWTTSTIIIPSIVYSNDYLILNDFENLFSMFLLMFGSSNLLDVKDINEDRQANISTIPVLIGEKNTIMISYFSILLSALLFTAGLYDYY